MSEPNLQDLLASRPSRGRRSKEATRRSNANVERTRRASAAQSTAKQALTYLYPDDYRALYLQALEVIINAERGPLPGDEDGAR